MEGLLDIGVTGATVINSHGMGRILSGEIPAVAGLKAVTANARPQNVTIFSVLESRELVDQATSVIEGICGDMNNPATGIIFSVPVSSVRGLAGRIENSGDATEDGSAPE